MRCAGLAGRDSLQYHTLLTDAASFGDLCGLLVARALSSLLGFSLGTRDLADPDVFVVEPTELWRKCCSSQVPAFRNN